MMYEKITILLRISDIDKYRQSIDSVMEQTYSNLDVWLFTDYFSTINEMKEKINISVYSYDEFEKYRIHKLPVDGYVLLLQENECFSNPDSLEKMYIQRNKEDSESRPVPSSRPKWCRTIDQHGRRKRPLRPSELEMRYLRRTWW